MPSPSNSNELEPVDKSELMLRAAELYIKGMSFVQIGREIGVSDVTAAKYAREQLNVINTPEELRHERDVQGARYDAMLAAHWDKGLKQQDSAYLVMHIMKAKADLFGFKAASKQQIEIGGHVLHSSDNPQGIPDVEREELEFLLGLVDIREKEKEAREAIVDGEIIDDDR